MEEIRETIRCCIFSYNKAQGKNYEHPNFVDVEQETNLAMERLEEILVNLAFQDADFDIHK